MKVQKISALLGILILGLAIGWWIGANVNLFPGLTAFGRALGSNRELGRALEGVEARERAYSLGFQATQRENRDLVESNRELAETNRQLGELQQETEAARREADAALAAAAGILAESKETARSAIDEIVTIGNATERVGRLLDRLEERIEADPDGPMD